MSYETVIIDDNSHHKQSFSTHWKSTLKSLIASPLQETSQNIKSTFKEVGKKSLLKYSMHMHKKREKGPLIDILQDLHIS